MSSPYTPTSTGSDSGMMVVSELIADLQIQDQSVAHIADELKIHATKHASWLGHLRQARSNLSKLEQELQDTVAVKVTAYKKSGGEDGKARSAASVDLYARHEVILHPEIKALRSAVARAKDLVSFLTDVSYLWNKRGDNLVTLCRMDMDLIVNTLRSSQSQWVDIRVIRKRWKLLEERLSGPWGNRPAL